MRATPGVISLILAVCAAFSAIYWWQASRPEIVVDAFSDRLSCVSYAPFHDDSQTPFDKNMYIDAEQIDADLALLSQRFDCVRIYSVMQGLHEVPRLAQKHGMKVLMGIWIGRNSADNEREMARGIDTAGRFPDAIRAVIVGNEVLLRGEQPPSAIRTYLERVHTALPKLQITYADVWEFWLRNTELAKAVTFVTVHILPYWEDRPIPVADAVGHVSHIYHHVKEQLKGKEVMIGETGWPSYGRQRQGALPSLRNQARFIREFEVRAHLEHIPYNVIEAFDQPWKRRQEGAVGGYWGLYDWANQAKFPFRGPVAEAPGWALAAVVTMAAVFAGFLALGRKRYSVDQVLLWLAVSVGAGGSYVVFWRDLWMANRDRIEWGVTGLYAALLIIATYQFGRPIAAWCASGLLPPRLAPITDWLRWVRRNDQSYEPAGRNLGALRFAFLFGAAMVNLLLVFDARYRDLPIALYALPSVGLALLSWIRRSDAHLEELLLAGWIGVGGVWVAIAEHLVTPPDQPWSWADAINPQSLVWAGLSLVLAGAVLIPVILELRARQGEHPEQESQG